ncbi:cupin domain-containing protein [Mesorhizobium sp. INR15]|uniref:cupin domain-containing protein n=1 Tax=Mesorhizobium sp. INR15 TaxID=2654248 RepID=UPI0018964BCD|nr:cupin domain-containing protein [Mesorhizobium sp. INR15]QPC92020.1 cupin domain-containing protein [Mesorhizobium sp. INR15]
MADEKAKPPMPFASESVPWTEWSDVPRFGLRYRHLSRAAMGENYHVGVAIEELPPAMRTAPAHYHMLEEEHVFILEGELTAHVGDAVYAMKTGDYICFPAGAAAGHCLVNTSDAPCRYVIVGERNPDDVVVYTASNKVLVRALGPRAIFDLAAVRGYWDGEDTGLPAGQPLPGDSLAGVTREAAKPVPPVSGDAVEWRVEGEGQNFGGHSRHLTYAALGRPDYHVGLLIEAPDPGKRLAPRHYHMLEEEHALILEGQVTLLLGEERHEMKAGDYVCFPAGLPVGHSFLNSGSGPCRYLMIGEHNSNEVCVYPDSNKMAVDALRRRDGIFDMAAVRRYWDGEA